ncbi:MAG TPA: AMP-binding protein [Saprospiraceae bacterium]|nr:AMP-binding protein [Saprospiraceae bacterium]
MSQYSDKVWLKQYPDLIPAEIPVSPHQDLNSFLREVMAKFASRPAFYFMDAKMTFSELDRYSDHFGAYLLNMGLKKGDKIALMMPNIFQYPVALFGCIKAGLVVVNTNPLYTSHEMEHQFKDSGVVAILIAENFAFNLEKIIHNTHIKHIVVTGIGDMLGGIKGMMINFVVRKIKKLVPAYHLPGAISFKRALSEGKKMSLPPLQSSLDDVVILQYTGGTSGIAKGAMLTNGNLLANMQQIRIIFLSVLKEGEEVGICALPLYHIFAFTVNCLALLSLGCPSVLIVNARDIPTLIKEWKKYPISIFPAVNTLFNSLMNHPDFKTIDFSKLKLPIAGAMALQKAVFDKWKKMTGSAIVEGYGLTETSPVACVNPVDGSTRVGTVGIPVPSTLVRIVDENGTEVPVGEVGEIQVKGPQVMKGYYNKPEETARTIINGWLSTGDMGLMSEDGYFTLVDRKKDMILVSGFNVYPNEIEDIAALHPKVLESAAIGVPNEKSGESVKLFVVKKDETLTEAELKKHFKEYLTNYKIPREYEFRSELPKTNVGKILRRALKQ